jgi:hypothetical protein
MFDFEFRVLIRDVTVLNVKVYKVFIIETVPGFKRCIKLIVKFDVGFEYLNFDHNL